MKENQLIGVFDDALNPDFCEKIIQTFESFPQVHTPGQVGSG